MLDTLYYWIGLGIALYPLLFAVITMLVFAIGMVCSDLTDGMHDGYRLIKGWGKWSGYTFVSEHDDSGAIRFVVFILGCIVLIALCAAVVDGWQVLDFMKEMAKYTSYASPFILLAIGYALVRLGLRDLYKKASELKRKIDKVK